MTTGFMPLLDPQLDAIVVPTSRPSEPLSYALALADKTGAFLLVLCSGQASAAEATDHIITHGVRGLAIDIPTSYEHPIFSGFKTGQHYDALFGRAANDIALKRNLGLILGRMAGWKTLLFLDDDISNIQGIDQALRTLQHLPATGFSVRKFPDNSVVRHAERLSGVEPGVRLTGSVLLVDLGAVNAFFPHVYNEDWFFLRGLGRQVFCAPTSGTALQNQYDPFISLERAISEEFGDVLAEGISDLTDKGQDYSRSTESDWAYIIAARQQLIQQIRAQLEARPRNDHTDAALRSLTEAAARLNQITPGSCVSYITDWIHDLDLFRERFAQLSDHQAPLEQIVEAEIFMPKTA